MISAASGAETFSYADRTQAELLADGSATGITYGLASQDGQPWVQDYTASGEQVNVLHDQQGDILGEVNSNAGTAQADMMYVTDGLGSVVAAIDSSGHATLTQPYTPYGLDAQTGPLDPMFTYTGALQDTIGSNGGTGFYHLGNRWYAPPTEPDTGVGNQLGPAHFTQPDAITRLVSPADGNLYAYAGCNPANYIDPAGAQAIYGWVCGFGGFAGSWVGSIASAASEAAGWSLFGLGSALVGTICYAESLNAGLSSQGLLQTSWITNMTVP
jgi:RHS repeat-associated protein